ncbi:MAG: macrolide-specific efflux protein maca [candidate division Zixibacteria bacterium RBG-1]|nr:MAG: macrolide-specific efflux protein maca [candidate division Zixibacteria bacterium RBG-1]OGC83925.1 MAG: hypothetical protein A2V73_03690 [candidate division Zixibacteria bacterium RBG_19FT_COMBO_42_43]
MKKKWLIIIGLVIVILVVGYPFIKKDKAVKKDQATLTSTATVKKGDLSIVISATGKIEPIRTLEIRSKASGEIIQLNVEDGDRVKKGQVIAKLEQTTALNDYEQAKADMQVAKVTYDQKEKEFNRQSGLYNKQLISEQEFETSKLGLETAKSQLVRSEAVLSSAKERLDDTVLESPMDGIILKKYVEEGQVISSGISNVSGGTLIATLADLNSVYVKADVDETDIGKVDFNQKVVVIADAFPEERFIGKVLRIAPLGQVDQNITVFQVTSQVNNSRSLLKAGMNVTVEIIAQDLKDVLLVPNEAVKTEQEAVQLAAMFNNPEKVSSESEQAWAKNRNNNNPDKSGQFMVKRANKEEISPEKFVLLMEKGKLKPVPVTVGVSDLDFTEIKSGLKEGEEVLSVSVSQMMQDREAMKERMRKWSSMPGLQKK